ncbi:hypothetical protein [Haladaptatus sp. NG-SE-30]
MTDEQSTVGRSRRPNRQTRRRFLAVAGGVTGGTLVGLSAVSTGQQTTTVQPVETFQFGGRVQAWQGQAPEDISDQENPTIQLQAGQVYEVTWENLDGQPHTFALQDSDGQNLPVIFPDVEVNTTGTQTTTTTTTGTRTTTGGTVTPPEDAIDVTEQLSQQGATQTLRFVATQDVAQYICTIHPTTMVGDVNLQGGGGGNGGNGGGNGGAGDDGGNGGGGGY